MLFDKYYAELIIDLNKISHHNPNCYLTDQMSTLKLSVAVGACSFKISIISQPSCCFSHLVQVPVPISCRCSIRANASQLELIYLGKTKHYRSSHAFSKPKLHTNPVTRALSKVWRSQYTDTSSRIFQGFHTSATTGTSHPFQISRELHVIRVFADRPKRTSRGSGHHS